ncbi:unnamed protein product [Vitrella brassicaformis CCMP3155]|uniref:Uncharacterized protein n=3 Tax=Vitrella brassicaformis TaxID=1169539 RepID=A0A0G4EJH0_VITBC|nr:unnamed protein product [Vitrella brassicaformis CCMP3155]|eukprot:CEL96669.1 unnamed protein product [Vitrella brassicaformis CCMP3155]
MRGFVSLAVVAGLVVAASAQPNNTSVLLMGALLNQANDGTRQRAIQLAVDDINANETLLGNRTVRLMVEDNTDDPVAGLLAVRRLIAARASIIVGPMSSAMAAEALPLAGFFRIPLVSPSATAPDIFRHESFFGLAASDASQVRAILSLAKRFRWTKLVIIHSDDTYGRGIQNTFVSMREDYDVSTDNFELAVRNPNTAVEILSGLSRNQYDAAVFVMAVSASILHTVLRAGDQIGIFTRGTAWLGTDTMPRIFSEPDFTNITQGFMAVTPSLSSQGGAADSFVPRLNLTRAEEESLSNYVLYSYDAAQLAARALDQALKGFNGTLPEPADNETTSAANVSSASFEVNPLGRLLLDALPDIDFDGVTGRVHLGEDREGEGRYVLMNNQGTDWAEVAKWETDSWRFTNESDLVWPGGVAETPRDCLFCGESCKVCADDKLAVADLYFALLENNQGVESLGRFNISRTFCRMWDAIICNEEDYELMLQAADLGGAIPAEIGQLSHCSSINLAKNKFDGQIPDLTPNLCPQDPSQKSKLKELYLEENSLRGTLPRSIGHCGSLTILKAGGNRLEAQLPDQVCMLTMLEEFEMARNNMQGSVPACIGGGEGQDGNVTYPGMKNLTHLYMQYNKLSGELPVSMGNLTKARSIFLHGNELSGNIPDVFYNVPLENQITLFENPSLTPGIPKSLAEKMVREQLRVVFEQLMFGCRPGYEPPKPALWRHFVVDDEWRSSDFCRPCSPGYYRRDDMEQCEACPVGNASPRPGMFECNRCPKGYHAGRAAISCLPCEPGFFAAFMSSAKCSECPEGTIAEEAAASTCTMCPIGANCTLPEQRANPVALSGYHRFTTFLAPGDWQGNEQRSGTPAPPMAGKSAVSSSPSGAAAPSASGNASAAGGGGGPSANDQADFDVYAQSSKLYTFLQCPDEERCLGENVCQKGSTGDLCLTCQDGFADPFLHYGPCRECEDPWWAWVKLGLILGVCFGMAAFLMRWTLIDGAESVGVQGSIFKIAQTWFEICGPAVGMAMEVVSLQSVQSISSFIMYLESLTNPLLNFVGLECAVVSMPAIHVLCILAFLFPPATVMVITGFYAAKVWVSRKRRPKTESQPTAGAAGAAAGSGSGGGGAGGTALEGASGRGGDQQDQTNNVYLGRLQNFLRGKEDEEQSFWAEVGQKATSCIVVLIVLLHPLMTKQFVINMNCITIDRPRVDAAPSVVCEGDHMPWYWLSVAGVLLWTLGLPLLVVVVMWRIRHRLHEENVKKRYGFLYSGYEPQFYWWEAWAMFRRVMVDLPEALPFVNSTHQLIVFLLLAVVSLFLNACYEPYDNRAFKVCDSLEAHALWAYLLTLLCVPVLESLNAESSVLEMGAEYAVVIFIIVFHGVFVVRALLWFCRSYIKAWMDTRTKALDNLKQQEEGAGDSNEEDGKEPHGGKHQSSFGRRVSGWCTKYIWPPPVPKVIRSIVMLDQGKIYLRKGEGARGELLDISRLSEREKDFVKEVVQEAVAPQLHKAVAYFDVFFVHEAIVRVFHRQATQKQLAEAREEIKRIDPNLLLAGTSREPVGIRMLKGIVISSRKAAMVKKKSKRFGTRGSATNSSSTVQRTPSTPAFIRQASDILRRTSTPGSLQGRSNSLTRENSPPSREASSTAMDPPSDALRRFRSVATAVRALSAFRRGRSLSPDAFERREGGDSRATGVGGVGGISAALDLHDGGKGIATMSEKLLSPPLAGDRSLTTQEPLSRMGTNQSSAAGTCGLLESAVGGEESDTDHSVRGQSDGEAEDPPPATAPRSLLRKETNQSNLESIEEEDLDATSRRDNATADGDGSVGDGGTGKLLLPPPPAGAVLERTTTHDSNRSSGIESADEQDNTPPAAPIAADKKEAGEDDLSKTADGSNDPAALPRGRSVKKLHSFFRLPSNTSSIASGRPSTGSESAVSLFRKVWKSSKTSAGLLSVSGSGTPADAEAAFKKHPRVRWRCAIQKVRLIVGIRQAFDRLARDARSEALQLGMTVEDLHVALLDDEEMVSQILSRQQNMHTQVLKHSAASGLGLDVELQFPKRAKSKMFHAVVGIRKCIWQAVTSWFLNGGCCGRRRRANPNKAYEAAPTLTTEQLDPTDADNMTPLDTNTPTTLSKTPPDGTNDRATDEEPLHATATATGATTTKLSELLRKHKLDIFSRVLDEGEVGSRATTTVPPNSANSEPALGMAAVGVQSSWLTRQGSSEGTNSSGVLAIPEEAHGDLTPRSRALHMATQRGDIGNKDIPVSEVVYLCCNWRN